MKKINLSFFFVISFCLFLLWLLFAITAGKLLIPAVSGADTRLFLSINSLHSAFWDPVMYYASSKTFWFPFYAVLIFFLVMIFRKRVWQILITIALLILSSDQLASHMVKNTVKRLRPSHEPHLIPFIHLSKAGPGGLYGFVSSHAANAFALAIFLTLILPRSYRPLKVILFIWAILVSYSRIYNGVHYPLDVIMAILLGILLTCIFYYLYRVAFYNNENDRMS